VTRTGWSLIVLLAAWTFFTFPLPLPFASLFEAGASFWTAFALWFGLGALLALGLLATAVLQFRRPP
jgi:hypothetical protein